MAAKMVTAILIIDAISRAGSGPIQGDKAKSEKLPIPKIIGQCVK